MANDVSERVRQHVRKILAQLSAHKQAGHGRANQEAAQNTAVEVDRPDTSVGKAGAKRHGRA